MKKTIKTVFIVAILLMPAFCATSPEPVPEDISFALIANTLPPTPYSEPDEKYAKLISDVNNSGVSFTIHMGNMIFSGPAEKTLNDLDIKKQIESQKKYTSALFSRFFHVTGEYDIYHKNHQLLEQELGPDYYSFNYGNTHFIVLNSNDTRVNFISRNQFSWLRTDFKNNHKFARFIIFLNHIPKLPPDDRHFRGLQTLNQNSELLNILEQHGRSDVIISNYGSLYFEFSDGNTTFINAPVSNLSDYTRKSENDFYIVSAEAGKIKVEGRRISK
ncbi:MAG: hypothetical protein JW982_16550 [Spirochaetes bacterium]|nr:hypothetical protein [Spirochaetota bacterium]